MWHYRIVHIKQYDPYFLHKQLKIYPEAKMFIIVLLAFAIFLLLKYLTSDFDYWKKRSVPFMKPTLFIGNFGNVLKQKQSIGGFLEDVYRKMPDTEYFGIWVFGTPQLVIRSPEVIRHILVKDFNHFGDRNIASDKDADPILAHIVFIQKNPLWRTVRAKLTPVFTPGKIKHMVPLIREAAAAMNAFVYREWAKNDEVELKEITAKFTTDVITSCVFGMNARSFENEDAEFRTVGRKMFALNFRNAMRRWSYFLAPKLVSMFKITFFETGVNEFCREAFWHAIDERKRCGIKRHDLIDIIIEMSETDGFEGDEAVAQAVQFFAAGFETTASTISFALYELALHKDYQDQLRNEIAQMMEDNPELDYAAIKSLKFLDQVVKETLRKYPVLPFLDRRCLENYTTPDQRLVIEKGTPVFVSILGLHYDEKYFKDPQVFDPDRFSEKNVSKIVSYSYLPFGSGPHNCIGEHFGLMGSKLGIISIISNFCLERTANTPEKLAFDPRAFTLVPVSGIPLRCDPIGRETLLAG